MIDDRTIGRTQPVVPQRIWPSRRAYLIAAVVGALIGFVLALVTAWLIVANIDPAAGMGI